MTSVYVFFEDSSFIKEGVKYSICSDSHSLPYHNCQCPHYHVVGRIRNLFITYGAITVREKLTERELMTLK